MKKGISRLFSSGSGKKGILIWRDLVACAMDAGVIFGSIKKRETDGCKIGVIC
jgi:hypothetical protein